MDLKIEISVSKPLIFSNLLNSKQTCLNNATLTTMILFLLTISSLCVLWGSECSGFLMDVATEEKLH